MIGASGTTGGLKVFLAQSGVLSFTFQDLSYNNGGLEILTFDIAVPAELEALTGTGTYKTMDYDVDTYSTELGDDTGNWV